MYFGLVITGWHLQWLDISLFGHFCLRLKALVYIQKEI